MSTVILGTIKKKYGIISQIKTKSLKHNIFTIENNKQFNEIDKRLNINEIPNFVLFKLEIFVFQIISYEEYTTNEKDITNFILKYNDK